MDRKPLLVFCMKFILGKKLGMTQVFRPDGTVVPVTQIQAGPCVVTQVKTKGKDGVDAIQVGFGEQKKFRLSLPLQGHLKDMATVHFLRQARMDETEVQNFKRGDMFFVKIFAPGERVQVVGTSKGKGFQGVVKRHNFRGGPQTHGHKDNLRMPGTIGAGGVQRVFKNVRMGGHMGDERITIKNLEVIGVDPAKNILTIKGAVPGARGGLLMISTQEGKIEVETMPAPEVASAPAEQAVENIQVQTEAVSA